MKQLILATVMLAFILAWYVPVRGEEDQEKRIKALEEKLRALESELEELKNSTKNTKETFQEKKATPAFVPSGKTILSFLQRMKISG